MFIIGSIVLIGIITDYITLSLDTRIFSFYEILKYKTTASKIYSNLHETIIYY
jgi:hypothetical protein